MPVKVGHTAKERSWGQVISAGTEAAAQAALLGSDGFSSAVSALFRAFEASRGEDTVEGKARLIIIESICAATSETLSHIEFEKKPNIEQFHHVINRIVSLVNSEIENGNVYIGAEDLKYPAKFSIIEFASELFQSEVLYLCPSQGQNYISRFFSESFARSFSAIRTRGYNFYQPLISALEELDTHAEIISDRWRKYRSKLISNFSNEPLFGQEGPLAITISQIYQPLRSIWIENGDDEVEESADASLNTNAPAKQAARLYHFDMLEDSVMNWIHGSGSDSRIKLISGGPGSGKSTFAKYISSKIAADDDWRVLFIPLQRLRGGGSLPLRIDEYFRTQYIEPFTQELGPLNSFTRDGFKNWLFVFDGLDELAQEGAGSENAAQEFATALSDWKNQVPTSVNALYLVLGRAPSMQQARKRLNLTGSGTFHVMDMLPTRHKTEIGVSGRRDSIVIDRKSVSLIDQRPQFWIKWAVANRESTEVPGSMSAKDLEDLTKEPLLAYLLILSGFATKDWEKAAKNRIYIYDAIFEKIWNRERTKQARLFLNDIGKSGFDAIMQALGLAAWRGGGRTGEETIFNQIRDTFIKQDLLQKARDCGAADLSNVAILFYTRKDEKEGKGYEFLHKSFGEYLTAKGLFNAFLRWSEQFRNSDIDFSEKEFLNKWIVIAGRSTVTNEVLGFLRNEAAARAEASPETDWLLARKWTASCAELMDYTINKGYNGQSSSTDWRQAEWAHNNAEMNLFCILDACGRVAYPRHLYGQKEDFGGWSAGPIRIASLSSEASSFTNFLNRMISASPQDFTFVNQGSIGIGHAFVCRLLTRLYIHSSHINRFSMAAADLFGTKISNSHIIHVSFVFSNLKFVEFSSSHLYAVEMSNCEAENMKIDSSSFSASDMIKTVFTGSSVKASRFIDSDLRGSDFEQVEFINSKFSNCVFSEEKTIKIPDIYNITEECIICVDDAHVLMYGRSRMIPEESVKFLGKARKNT